jgi:hypothetical protein
MFKTATGRVGLQQVWQVLQIQQDICAARLVQFDITSHL